MISGRIPRPNQPKSRDSVRCIPHCSRSHLLSLLPASSHCLSPSPSLPTTIPWPSTGHCVAPLSITTPLCAPIPGLRVGFVPLTELKLTSCRFSSHSVDFASLRSPRYLRAPVGLKTSKSVFLDTVFLFRLILPGHRHSYIDAYSCLHPLNWSLILYSIDLPIFIGVLSFIPSHRHLRYVFLVIDNSHRSNHWPISLSLPLLATLYRSSSFSPFPAPPAMIHRPSVQVFYRLRNTPDQIKTL